MPSRVGRCRTSRWPHAAGSTLNGHAQRKPRSGVRQHAARHSSKLVSRPLLVLPGVKPASSTNLGESLQTFEALARLPLFGSRQSVNRRLTAAAWPRLHHFCASQLGGGPAWWRECFPWRVSALGSSRGCRSYRDLLGIVRFTSSKVTSGRHALRWCTSPSGLPPLTPSRRLVGHIKVRPSR
jgi:hypothetical protein